MRGMVDQSLLVCRLQPPEITMQVQPPCSLIEASDLAHGI